ncbi:MAG: hypothetical protein KDK41_08895 [Leptospiraceae bacterium]|nr:hypothetical protein [Leptospiraceae bacterium]
MPLVEVRNDIVKQHGHQIQKRFYHDGKKRCSVNLWVRKSDSLLERFQASLPGHVFEWKENGMLRYAREDEGDNPMGMKQSPVMLMTDKVNQRALKEFIRYLKIQMTDRMQELQPVMEILKGAVIDEN